MIGVLNKDSPMKFTIFGLRRMLWGVLLAIYICFLILFSNPHNTYIANAVNIFLFAMFALESVFLNKQIKVFHHPFTDLYLLFVVFAYFSVLWSASASYTAEMCWSMIQMAINNFLIYNLLRKYDLFKYFIIGFVAALILNYLYGFGLISLDVEHNENWRFEGTAGNSNEMGIYIFFSMFLVVLALKQNFLNNKFLVYMMLALGLYFAVMTGSRKTLMVVILYLIYVFFSNMKFLFNLKNIALIFFLMFSIAQMVDFNELLQGDSIQRNIERLRTIQEIAQGVEVDGSVKERNSFIEFGISMIIKNPIIGYGLGSFIILEPSGHYSHNNYIELLFGTGILGLFLFYGGVLSLVFQAIKRRSIDIVFIILLLLVLDYGVVTYNLKPNLLIFVFFAAFLTSRHTKIDKMGFRC